MQVSKFESIKNSLKKIPGLWFLEEDKLNINSIKSLYNFLDNINRRNKNFLGSDIKPLEINYNNSIFHFLIYYCYYPKIPFVFIYKDVIIFGHFDEKKKDTLTISFSNYSNIKTCFETLDYLFSNKYFKKILDENKINSLLLRDIDDNFVNFLKENKQLLAYDIDSMKELYYRFYDLKETVKLKGNDFSNLRWHLNCFKKQNHDIEIVDLKNNVKSVIHFIGKWRSNAINNRNFSFIDVRSDKMGAKIFGCEIYKSNKFFDEYNTIIHPNNVISRVLKINGKVSAFNLGFALGIFNKKNVFAHVIGLSDISISHLSEFAQYDFWENVFNNGYEFVNDGPSWRSNLTFYKDKFRPFDKKRFYWANIKIK